MQNNENKKCKIILGIRLCQAANKKINMPQTFPTCGTGRSIFFLEDLSLATTVINTPCCFYC